MDNIKHIVFFHGSLGEEFGTDGMTIYGSNIQDIFQGLVTNIGFDFKQTIRNNEWHIVTGERKDITTDNPIESDNLMRDEEIQLLIPYEEIHVFPKVKGSGGVLRIILGVILIIIGAVVAVFAGPLGAAIIGAGIGVVIGGVTALLTKSPKLGGYESAEVDQRPSFLFNGAVNVVEQGGAVPVVCGIHETGSTVISAGMYVEQL